MLGLAACPGTVRARRFRNPEGSPRYHSCYDLTRTETLGSPPWLAVRHTTWSDRVRPHFRNVKRTDVQAAVRDRRFDACHRCHRRAGDGKNVRIGLIMARIIGGIGTSHVPTIGGAYDREQAGRPRLGAAVQGLRAGQRLAGREAARRARVLLQRPREHLLLRPLPDLRARRERRRSASPTRAWGRARSRRSRATPALARHMAESLVNDEFDISVFQDLPIDHGVHSPLTMFWPPAPDWPGKIVPIEINVLQHPIPTPLRCWKLGQAVRRAVLSYPEDLDVVIVGTGGLSHQMNGERGGFNNEKWDMKFLDLIARRPEEAHRDAPRRLHPPGRHRGRRGDHVARDARRAAHARARKSTRTTTCR